MVDTSVKRVIIVSTLYTGVNKKKTPLKLLLAYILAITRTTRPNICLFVLVVMHFQ